MLNYYYYRSYLSLFFIFDKIIYNFWLVLIFKIIILIQYIEIIISILKEMKDMSDHTLINVDCGQRVP